MRVIVLLGFIMLPLFHVSPQKLELSLKEIIDLAIDQNPMVKNANLGIDHAEISYKDAKGKLLPQVSVFSNLTYNYSIPKMVIPGEIFGQSGPIPVEFGTKYDWNSGLDATQIIFNQSYFTNLKLLSEITTLNHLNKTLTEEDLLFNIAQLYYLCVSLKEQQKALETAIINMDKIGVIAELQMEGGTIRKVDRSRVSIDQNNLVVERDNLLMLYQQQINMLKYLSGIDLNTIISLKDSLANSETSFAIPLSTATPRIENRLMEQKITIAHHEKNIEKQSALPEVSLFARHYYQGMRDEFDFFDGGDDRFFKAGYIGLQVNIPLFDGFQRRNKVEMQDITFCQLMNDKANLTNQLTREYEDAVLQYRNSIIILENRKKNMLVASQVHKVSLEGYRQGVVSLTDLLISENQLTQSCISKIDALYQLKKSELALKRASGSLVFE